MKKRTFITFLMNNWSDNHAETTVDVSTQIHQFDIGLELPWRDLRNRIDVSINDIDGVGISKFIRRTHVRMIDCQENLESWSRARPP
jgi:hypothetical protein